jgi:glycosyltransferase involved in cell wall biosynthesis
VIRVPSSREPHVTVCVPVYNGATFVAETLEAVRRQSYEHLTVLVSDDGSSDGSVEICERFAATARFRIIRQPSRLGWIDHCNWLLHQAHGDYACIVSHDDLPEPDHIARLVECLEPHPEAALAFSDIRVFGLLDQVEHQESIAGTPTERVRAFIAGHYDGTAFHALIRRSAIAAAGGLRGNRMDHFAADVSWLGRLARAGEFRRLPEPLYRKRRHAASASLQWGRWDDETRAEAWGMHCGELLHDALAAPLTQDASTIILHAALRRLLAIEPALPFAFIRNFTIERQAALIATLLSDAAGGCAMLPDLARQDPSH